MTTEKELLKYNETIQSFNKDTAQDVQALRDYMVDLTAILARCNFLMAETQRKHRESKKAAYLKFFGSELQETAKLNKTNARDFVDSCCSNTGYLYDLSERTSRSAYHQIEALRSVLSSLKNEQNFSHL